MTINIGAEMLRKAALVIEERQKAYGPPNKNFKNIAGAWTWWLQARYGEVITVKLDEVDVAMMNDLQKSARLAETPGHEDSWVDKAGYSACGRQVSGPVDEEEVGERTEPHLPDVWNTEPVPVEQETTGPLHHDNCYICTVGECTCRVLKKENKVERHKSFSE